jgi:hypothetical protein
LLPAPSSVARRARLLGREESGSTMLLSTPSSVAVLLCSFLPRTVLLCSLLPRTVLLCSLLPRTVLLSSLLPRTVLLCSLLPRTGLDALCEGVGVGAAAAAFAVADAEAEADLGVDVCMVMVGGVDVGPFARAGTRVDGVGAGESEEEGEVGAVACPSSVATCSGALSTIIRYACSTASTIKQPTARPVFPRAGIAVRRRGMGRRG